MGNKLEKIDVVVASPSDVESERQAVLQVFHRWNDKNSHAVLHAKKWESAVPQMGDHPQHILNKQLIAKSDLLIAIFWTRLGTPTSSAISGTVEEINEFMRLKGPGRVMLYFCTRAIPHNIDAAELGKLQNFKREMQSCGLYHQFETTQEFERDLYSHLDAKIEELQRGELPIPDVLVPKAEKTTELKGHADPRLDTPIDFGSSLEVIADEFHKRTSQFIAIDGVHKDKYYDLAAHVYASGASSMDRALNQTRRLMKDEDEQFFERTINKLKRLAARRPGTKDPFPEYFIDGHEISTDLLAHISLMNKWKR